MPIGLKKSFSCWKVTHHEKAYRPTGSLPRTLLIAVQGHDSKNSRSASMVNAMNELGHQTYRSLSSVLLSCSLERKGKSSNWLRWDGMLGIKTSIFSKLRLVFLLFLFLSQAIFAGLTLLLPFSNFTCSPPIPRKLYPLSDLVDSSPLLFFYSLPDKTSSLLSSEEAANVSDWLSFLSLSSPYIVLHPTLSFTYLSFHPLSLSTTILLLHFFTYQPIFHLAFSTSCTSPRRVRRHVL